MRRGFVDRVLRAVQTDDPPAIGSSWLAVCAGSEERDIFLERGFRDVTISNLDVRLTGNEFAPYRWSSQNAQKLAFVDDSFDYVFVSDGLHHCASPHGALLEMYRVARKAIVVVESRDSTLVRLAERLGLARRYEIDAVIGNDFAFGGVNNSAVPNFVYRWTERELEKTILAFNPSAPHRFRFFYALNLPERGTNTLAERLLHATTPVVELVGKIFPRQCNSFAMIAYKPQGEGELWPWLKREGSDIVFRRDYSL